MKKYTVIIDGEKINADIDFNSFNGMTHIVFTGKKPNAVSETGYRSYFSHGIVKNTDIQTEVQKLAEVLAEEEKVKRLKDKRILARIKKQDLLKAI